MADWYMTDAEILDSWNRAIDKRDHVQILADRNVVSPREMLEKLIELGASDLDKRWLNGGCKGQKPIKEVKPIALDLTQKEAYTLANMIDAYLFEMIRYDDNANDVSWLCRIVHTFEKLCAFSGYKPEVEEDDS